jgi:hypothetical protein
MDTIINNVGLCVTVEVNILVIMNNNRRLYETTGWELDTIANK